MQIILRSLSFVFFCTTIYSHASDYYLVLASANQQNAASAMGHLFLVDGNPDVSPEWWPAIDYTAHTESRNVVYIIKGVAGGFEAIYKVQPLSKKIEQYYEKEKRELIFFPLHFSEAEKERFNDTLTLWLKKKEDYKFATNNCAHGIYRLLQASADSLPEPYAILLPQDVITLLQTENKIGKPKSYISPHPYLKAGFGFRFIENSMLLNFQPLLHDKYDRYGFYQADHEFSFLDLSVGVNENSLFIDNFSIVKLTSASPHKSISWFIDSKLYNSEAGIGKSLAVYGSKFAVDYFFKIMYEKSEYFIAPQFAFRSRSTKKLRYGMQGELLRNMHIKEIKPMFKFWHAYDLSEKNTLIMKSNLSANANFEVMLRTYFVR
ncbi:hypothetical protein R83H12_00579 [Fibrobacteria bacterium R8-3-H12]